jgi:hypothetical protein
MAIRIRKLAKEIGCAPEDVIALLQRLAQKGYADPEKQIPAGVEALVRRHAKELADAAARGITAARRVPPAPAAGAGPPSRGAVLGDGFEDAMLGEQARVEREASRAADEAALRAALAGVRPIAKSASSAAPPRPAAGGPSQSRSAAAPAPSAPALSPGARAGHAPLGARPGAPPELVLGEQLAAAREELARVRAHAELAATELVAARADLTRLRDALTAAEQARDDADAHRRALSRELSARDAQRAPTALRAVFERRGLRGDDEIAMTVRALVDARRTAELVDAMQLLDPRALEEVLWNRLLLVAEGEELPPGLVGVRVPADRSEAPDSGPNRAAMTRFSTACLVRGARKIVIVGGSPAYHRVLREGIDKRIDLRLVDGTRRGQIPEVQRADFVFVWASTLLDHRVSEQFPEAVVLPSRGLARMLAEATARVEGA